MTNSSARIEAESPARRSLRWVRSRYSPGVSRVTLLRARPLKGWTTRTQNGWASRASNSSTGAPASASSSWKYSATLKAGRRERATPTAATMAPRTATDPARMLSDVMSHLDLAHAEDDQGAEGHEGGRPAEDDEPPALVHGLHVVGADHLDGQEHERGEGGQHPGRDATLGGEHGDVPAHLR